MRLPNADELVVEREKIVDYLLNADHQAGATKAAFFDHFGFRIEEWEALAGALLEHGRDKLGFTKVFAITSQDNDVSGKLLEKLGFSFDRIIATPEGEKLKLFDIQL